MLKTERLSIRPFTFEDAPFILQLLNEPAFVKNIADKGVRDLEGAIGYLRDGPMASYEKNGFGLWRVGLLESDVPIGMAGFLKRDYLPAIDVGYALLSGYCGDGYGAEMTSAIMQYAEFGLGLHTVLAIVNEDNEASIRLLRQLRFEPNGKVRLPAEDNEVLLYVYAVSQIT